MAKKSMLVIGMGNFGSHLAESLVTLGNDVMIIDRDEKVISDLTDKINPSNSWFGDCTSESAIKTLGVKNFDVCFVTVGSDFQASLQITSLLKKFGAKCVVCKAIDGFQEGLLYLTGATKVINPEEIVAKDQAKSYTYDNMYDYVEVDDGFATADAKIPWTWAGKTVAKLDIRKKWDINIFAIKTKDGGTVLPGPDYVFQKGDHIKFVGTQHAVKTFGKKRAAEIEEEEKI